MKTTNIFEYASRNKLRFPFKGMISAEDLWDLSLVNLDGIFKTLNKQAKLAEEESLLTTGSGENEELEVQIAIVKHIVSVKKAEKIAREKAAEKKAKREEIMSILASKQNEALQNSSVEELQKMLEDLSE